ncbi:hypothetical protein E1176_16500 [Fulvivirga sp. RKSG066]|uniref:hypothetical protein n=1 Tax=Fulvivirga aurantia TaxID=2529383 RepID=UPI0012BBE3C7|nr:hypothetical protein [Fulvivirga aurantia]MTI22634.1 hypothetical protein [Fulvivirga aurantia]
MKLTILTLLAVALMTSCQLQAVQDDNQTEEKKKNFEKGKTESSDGSTYVEFYDYPLLKYYAEYLETLDPTEEVEKEKGFVAESIKALVEFDATVISGGTIPPPMPCPGHLGELMIDPLCLGWSNDFSKFRMGLVTHITNSSSITITGFHDNQPVATGYLVDYDDLLKKGTYEFDVENAELITQDLLFTVNTTILDGDEIIEVEFSVGVPEETFIPLKGY